MSQENAFTFLELALGVLPADPRQITYDELPRLAAVHAGLQHHTDDVVERHGELARSIVEEDIDSAALVRAAAELRELDNLHALCVLADHRLTAYSRVAVRAHGFDLDRLAAG